MSRNPHNYEAAGEDRNLVPTILDCVRAELTLGEIASELRAVYGEYEGRTS